LKKHVADIIYILLKKNETHCRRPRMQAVQKPQTKQMHDRNWKEVKTDKNIGLKRQADEHGPTNAANAFAANQYEYEYEPSERVRGNNNNNILNNVKLDHENKENPNEKISVIHSELKCKTNSKQ